MSAFNKRKKTRSKKTVPVTSTLNYFLHQNVIPYETELNRNSNYWATAPPNQRLFPPLPDPSVGNFLNGAQSVLYPLERPVPIPPPHLWELESTAEQYCQKNNSLYPVNKFCYERKRFLSNNKSNRTVGTSTDSVYSSTKNENFQEFASLPPVIIHSNNTEEDSKRRSSDPGLGSTNHCGNDDENDNNEEIRNDNLSSGRSSVESAIDKNSMVNYYFIIEQINALRENNRALVREMHDMKNEINNLRQQVWKNGENKSSYEPGDVSNIIKEIRDAVKIREDAFFAKVRHWIEEKIFNRTYGVPSFHSNGEVEELKNKLKSVEAENEKFKRLMQFEEQLQKTQLHSSSFEECLREKDDLKEVEVEPTIYHSMRETMSTPLKSMSSSKLSRSSSESNVEKTPSTFWGNLKQFFTKPNLTIVDGTIVEKDELNEYFSPASTSKQSVNESKQIDSTLGVGGTNETEMGVHSHQPGADQVLEMEQETLQLRRDLQEAVAGRKAAEAKNFKYEREMLQQRRHKTSSDTSCSGGGPTGLNTSLEGSLFLSADERKDDSVFGNISPIHGVTLSGPVTDL